MFECAGECARLAVEIDDIEAVEVGNVELADAEPGEGQQVGAADTAKAGDGHAPAAQALLLGARQPANVAGEGAFI